MEMLEKMVMLDGERERERDREMERDIERDGERVFLHFCCIFVFMFASWVCSRFEKEFEVYFSPSLLFFQFQFAMCRCPCLLDCFCSCSRDCNHVWMTSS